MLHRCMLIRFVFNAHRLGFSMLQTCMLIRLGDWVPIRFVFECYSGWGFECHMPKWNPLIKKLVMFRITVLPYESQYKFECHNQN